VLLIQPPSTLFIIIIMKILQCTYDKQKETQDHKNKPKKHTDYQ